VRADPALRRRLSRPLPRAEKLRLAVEIAASYLRVQRRIRSAKLEELLALLRGEVTDARVAAWRVPDEHVRAVRVARPVGRLLPRLPGDSRCLTQSLVLTAMLARRGIGSSVVIAVSPAPEFKAHAWVEHGGVPLLPPGDAGYGRLVEL
jgi:hypothetical protein